ncbi:MAG TPA: NAD(P)-binding domain-containing protein, partial [Polyangiaceae bacterium LLY-WYZ-15_(1-7)]|nr:NAD(P)-binding domain-containing protein [Polyangiaceae bacterium LLY-WYZ-15_(1-7)]
MKSQRDGTFERGARVCVIGAGPSGIAAAKALLDEGYANLTIVDRGREVGGNWVFDADSGHSSVFETTHIISSKKFSAYDDFPMPEDYPDYPSHWLLAEYFQAYARHFGLYPFIEFETLVERCEKRPGGGWRVTTTKDGRSETRDFEVLVVANGHHWKPRWPSYPGELECEYLHSHDFKRAEPFRGKRVLVIGGGNSACDVAVETSRVSGQTDLSWRRGYWVVPKFLFGLPGDHIHNFIVDKLSFVPAKARLKGLELLLRLMNGPNAAYGLPDPDHPFGTTHPTLNSELLYFIRHGEIRPRPDVARWEGRRVHFTDGRSAEYDAVIACTGFEIAHPFFDPELIDYSEGPVPLYLKMIPEQHDDLYFIGLFQPLGCIWPSSALQAKIMARRMAGAWSPPRDLGAAIRHEMANPDVEQLDTPRHTITVDAPLFRQRLLAELPA